MQCFHLTLVLFPSTENAFHWTSSISSRAFYFNDYDTVFRNTLVYSTTSLELTTGGEGGPASHNIKDIIHSLKCAVKTFFYSLNSKSWIRHNYSLELYPLGM